MSQLAKLESLEIQTYFLIPRVQFIIPYFNVEIKIHSF